MSSRLRTALEFLLYALLAAIMLWATWLTWPDAFIDFSRELYLPWRVSQGDVLYRDLAYYFGPLSVYLNAALFALLGRPSIHALFALNFTFWLATLLALRALLRRIASPFAATVAVASFILLFSFNRYLAIGNYNFLAPYSHELPRGFLLALLAMLSIDSAFRRLPFSLHRFALPGLLFGLVAYTKPEVFLAASAAVAVRFLPVLSGHRTALCTLLRPAFVFLAAALGSLLLVPALLSLAMPFPEAIHSALFRPFLDCLNPEVAGLEFFRRISGVDNPLFHLGQMATGTILAAIPLAAAGLLSSPPATRRLPPYVRLALLSLLCLAVFPLVRFAFWQLNAALPLAPLVFAIIVFRPSGHCPLTPAPFRLHLAAAFAAFAFVLALKIILNASITHYGFVLALPSFCCAVLLLVDRKLSPASARVPAGPLPEGNPGHRSGGGALAKPLFPRLAVPLTLLLAFSARALSIQHTTIREAAFVPVARGAYRAPKAVASYLGHTLAWIDRNIPPEATLAVIPEGAVLNVLAGHPASNPFFMLEQGTYLRSGEANILRAYQSSPPDFLLLVKKEVLVSNEPRFGIDYAQPLMAFLDANYSPVLTLPVQTPAGIQPFFLLAARNPGPAVP